MSIFFKIIKKISIYFVTLILVTTFFFFLLSLFFLKSNENIFINYFIYIKKIFTNDFGQINNSNVIDSSLSIDQVFFKSFSITLVWTFVSFIFAFAISTIISFWIILKNNKFFENAIQIINSIIIAIPIFILVAIFFLINNFLNLPNQFLAKANLGLQISSIMPAIIILIISIIPFMISTSLKILNEITNSNYYLFAKSKGYNTKKLITKVILKIFIIRILKQLISIYLVMFIFAVVLERIFKIEGLSLIIVYSVIYQELNLLMFYLIISLSILFIFQIILEIIVENLDPANFENIVNNNWYSKILFALKRKKHGSK